MVCDLHTGGLGMNDGGYVDNVRGRRVRLELRRLRREADLSLLAVAEQLGISQTKLSRMETGHRSLNVDDVSALLGYYGAPRPLRLALLKLLREASSPGWWDRGEMHLHEDLQFWIELEDDAVSMRNYQPLLIPGLLQTDHYACAVISGYGVPLSDREIDERVAARMGRKRLLQRWNRFHLHVLLHEAALHQQVGGAHVMREQLTYLLEAAALPTVTLQVVPSGVGAHPGLGDGPFALLDYHSLPALVHLENKVSSLYLEKQTDVATYTVSFNEILALAHGRAASVELIQAIVDTPPG
jgi:transcriptional regulator with XRE-family HTH domain